MIALWVAISSNLAIVAVLWPRSQAVDFAVFWRAAHALNPYAANEQPFVYPPTALLWFSPLKLVDVWSGYLIWTAVSLVLFAMAALRLYGRGATALAMISPAMSVGLIPGQSSFIAAAMLLAAFATECRLCRGVLLGMLLTFKPQLVIIAPLFLIVSGDWRALVSMFLTALLIALATSALFGAEVWSAWIKALPAFQQVVAHRGLSMSEVSPAAFANSLGFPRLPLLLLGCVAALIIALESGFLNNGERAAMIATASLLAAPYALRYDLIAIAPAMATVILSTTGRKALLACVAYSATFGPLSLAAGTAVVEWRSPDGQSVKRS